MNDRVSERSQVTEGRSWCKCHAYSEPTRGYGRFYQESGICIQLPLSVLCSGSYSQAQRGWRVARK